MAGLRNFRDRLRENNNTLARKYDLRPEQLDHIDEDVKTLEKSSPTRRHATTK